MVYAELSPRWADAEPVREHVKLLSAYGISYQRVRTLTGMPNSTMMHLMYGQPDRGLPPARRIRRSTHDSVMAIRPTLELCSPRGNIDSTITRRKLRSMVAMGYSMSAIGTMLPSQIDKTNVAKLFKRTRCRGWRAMEVRDLFDKYWDQRPTYVTNAEKAVYFRVLRYAESFGFVTAMSWEDIDDPNEPHPKPGLLYQRVAHKYSNEVIREEIAFLQSMGESAISISKRLGITERTLKDNYGIA